MERNNLKRIAILLAMIHLISVNRYYKNNVINSNYLHDDIYTEDKTLKLNK